MVKAIEISKDALKQLYTVEGKKLKEIAAMYGCTESTVSVKLKNYGLRKKIEDKFVGKPFGLLTPTRFIEYDKHGHAVFECICECGKIVPVLGNALQTGNTSTCGCEARKRGKDHPHFRGYESITSSMWSSIKRHAKTRDIDFRLTIEQAWAQFLKQGKKCALTGQPLVFAPTRITYNQSTASLDRIDSQGIYEPSNVQWIHKRLNWMKSDMAQDEFVEWCKKVAEYN